MRCWAPYATASEHGFGGTLAGRPPLPGLNQGCMPLGAVRDRV